MKWKQGLPTKTGWYWYRNLNRLDETKPVILQVRTYVGELAIGNTTLKGWPSKEKGEWAGPIDEPEE